VFERNRLYSSLQARPRALATRRTATDTVPNGICDPSEAEEIFKEIQKYMEFMFQFRPKEPIRFRLMPYQELYRRSIQDNGKRTNPVGLCSKEQGRITIYVRRGLPADQFYSVLAHEYAHAWQTADGFMGGSIERSEGFAEWVAHHLTHLAGYDADRLFQNQPCTLYSSGLYKFQTIEDHYGFHGAIRAGKSNQTNLKVLRAPGKS
jgi:hypothetical protein